MLLVRFRIHSLLLATAVIAAIFSVVHVVLRFDDPLAVVVVSNDANIILTQEVVLELTADALRKVGLEPVRPEPVYGDESDPERFLGRNVLRPNDAVRVQWFVRGGDYPRYSVRVERESSQIKATICPNWL